MKIPHQGMVNETMLKYRNAIIADIWRVVENDSRKHGDTEIHKRLVFKILGLRRCELTGRLEGKL